MIGFIDFLLGRYTHSRTGIDHLRSDLNLISEGFQSGSQDRSRSKLQPAAFGMTVKIPPNSDGLLTPLFRLRRDQWKARLPNPLLVRPAAFLIHFQDSGRYHETGSLTPPNTSRDVSDRRGEFGRSSSRGNDPGADGVNLTSIELSSGDPSHSRPAATFFFGGLLLVPFRNDFFVVLPSIDKLVFPDFSQLFAEGFRRLSIDRGIPRPIR